ncbi:MAG: helix-turn-helix transcriptional regulator [Aestuariibaculum sp.]
MNTYKRTRTVFWRFYDFISYSGINETTLDDEVEQKIMINRYFAILFFVFFFLSSCNLLFLGFTKGCVSLFIMSLFCGICFFLLKNISNNTILLLPIFILLPVTISYFSSFCGLESGVFLYFFPLLLAIPIFFNYAENKWLIVCLILFILINIYVSAFSNFQLISQNPIYKPYGHKLLIINITCVLLLFAINSFFLEEKRAYLGFLQGKDFYRKKQVQDLNAEVVRLKKIINQGLQSNTDFNKLIDSIELNDTVFIDHFEKFFPYFCQKIKRQATDPLTISDLKFCALLKLNFTTKQIAVYTNATIKSAESKKYRLRKKLGIPKDVNITHYFSNF